MAPATLGGRAVECNRWTIAFGLYDGRATTAVCSTAATSAIATAACNGPSAYAGVELHADHGGRHLPTGLPATAVTPTGQRGERARVTAPTSRLVPSLPASPTIVRLRHRVGERCANSVRAVECTTATCSCGRCEHPDRDDHVQSVRARTRLRCARPRRSSRRRRLLRATTRTPRRPTRRPRRAPIAGRRATVATPTTTR